MTVPDGADSGPGRDAGPGSGPTGAGPGVEDLGFVHVFRPGTAGPLGPTLLLLHGTGGDEWDLVNLGRGLAPAAAILSPRGRVIEAGMPRFFRRLAPGVFDEADLVARSGELAAFVAAATEHYGLDPRRVVAVGYSNGANIAASLLLLRPRVLAGAVLLHPMTPLVPATLPELAELPVLVTAGRADEMVPAAETLRLVGLLRAAGAAVAVHWQNGGHALADSELKAARTWLRLTRLVPES